MVTIWPFFRYMVLHPEGQSFIHHVSWGYFYFLFFWRVLFLIPWTFVLWGYLNQFDSTTNHPSEINKNQIVGIVNFLFLDLFGWFFCCSSILGPSCSVNAVQPSERNTIQCRCCMHVFLCHVRSSPVFFFFNLSEKELCRKVIKEKLQFPLIKP